MAPPKKKQRGSGLLSIFLKEGDWRTLKTQLLKIVDKLTSFSQRLDDLEAGNLKVANSDEAGALSPELFAALQNLLVPVIGEQLTRVDSKNYRTEFKYENIQIFRNGQEITSTVTLDGVQNVQFDFDVADSELITATYSKNITS